MARSTGQTLTPDQIAALIRKHFPADMSEEDVRIGIAIVYAESGGNPTLVYDKNRNGSIDRGLWQINSVHKPDLSRIFDPEYNTEMAAGVYTRAGRKWTPWSAFKNGKYREHLDKANQANVPASGGTVGGIGGLVSGLNPFNIANNAMENVTSDIGGTITRIYSSLIMYIIALVLFIVGVIIILRNPARKAVGAALGAVPAKGIAAKAVKAAVT